MIARAASELALGEVTMRSVANRLGVSVPSLYHYVAGRDDLLRLAAEQSAARLSLPEDHGQHWAEWLAQWADHVRLSFGAEPALLQQFAAGVFGFDRMVDHLDLALAVLVKQGFGSREALDAYHLVTACGIGAAVADIRERAMAEAGHPVEQDHAAVLSARPENELPHLRAALAPGSAARRTFAEQLAVVLAGIAVTRGDDWEAIMRRIAGT